MKVCIHIFHAVFMRNCLIVLIFPFQLPPFTVELEIAFNHIGSTNYLTDITGGSQSLDKKTCDCVLVTEGVKA